jgi:Ferritin-like domain
LLVSRFEKTFIQTEPPAFRLRNSRDRKIRAERGKFVFGKRYVSQMIERSAENPDDRRRFMRSASVAGLGLVGAGLLVGAESKSASAATDAEPAAISDGAILNFALNLEYLEAEFYSNAVHGHGIPASLTTGTGKLGPVTGGHQVPFQTKAIKGFATEIARDEYNHVAFLRKALGSAAVARPAINIQQSFTAAATAAGLIKKGQTFNPYANEDNFLLAAFIFEDVGVTAYKGAAPLISNKTYLGAAAGILAVEAYHAATVRSSLYNRESLIDAADKISVARNSLDGKVNDDQGISVDHAANIVPTDGNSLVFGRTPGQVLNVVYLTPKPARTGGFFPAGVNGTLNTSA